MIKLIKSWFEKSSEGGVVVHVDAILYSHELNALLIQEISKEVSTKIALIFLQENKEAIQKEILQNPKFADAVYNAIVLKKANEFTEK